MKLQSPGKITSSVEVTQISLQGIWMLVKEEEFFLSYEEFPWFQHATVAQIHHVRLLHGDHICWSDLDIDLHVDSLRNLEKYPLTYIR
ncbi:MAG: DUF2442 domain-containing protein [Candidatus Omnitrophota bacterium]